MGEEGREGGRVRRRWTNTQYGETRGEEESETRGEGESETGRRREDRKQRREEIQMIGKVNR